MNTLPIESNGDDLYVTFTDDLLDELGWNVGDDLDWEINSNGTITLKQHDQETSPSRPQRLAPQVQECVTSYGTPLHDC